MQLVGLGRCRVSSYRMLFSLFRMNENSVHLLMCALFHWHMSMEMDGLPPINILHRVMTEGAVTRSGHAGSTILCPDMSPQLRRAQAGFNSLELAQKIIVVTKHMPVPLKDCGKPQYKKWGDREKAQYLNEPMSVFKVKYRKICRQLGSKI